MKGIYFCRMSSVAAAALLAAAGTNRANTPIFEPEPREVLAGRSPRFLVRQAQGLFMGFVRPAANGKGQDLYFQASTDAGDTFEPPMRINNVPGEVSDHGENSPVLVPAPDSRNFYAVWNARDPKDPASTVIRFSGTNSMRLAFSPAITVNDDNLPVSHSFHTANVAPDGTIYVAWLDGRDRATPAGHGGAHAGHDMSGEGNSSIYLARSTDNGRTFSKNVRVAGNVCPCCRLTIAFPNGKVLVGYRQVDPGDVRDIYVAASSDKGDTWEKPQLVARDGWRIIGCPHVGPALAMLGSKLYAAWFTEGGGDPAINLAVSNDGGKTFGPKQKISAGTTDPTHPQMVSNGQRIALIFQARSAAQKNGWGRVGIYYREIQPDGSLSELVRLPDGKANASFPSVTLGQSGRVFIGWTQTGPDAQSVQLVRGRSQAAKVPGEQ